MHYVPQTGSVAKPRLTWFIVLFASVLLMSLIVGAPLALARGDQSIAYSIYLAFSYICHQIPARSFFIAGHTFAVCSRCTGIYGGFLLGTLAYPLIKSWRNTATPRRKWLFVAAVPVAIDFSLEFFGIWHNTHFSRLATGALLGAVAVFYVVPGLIELSLRQRGRTVTANTDATAGSPAAVATTISSAPSDYSAPHRRI
jgi:uncharacterized membrane protein